MNSVRWTSNLPKADRADFESKLRAAKAVLRRLNQLAKEDMTSSEKDMRKRENFFMPAWSEKQAFELGYQKALQTIIKLTEV